MAKTAIQSLERRLTELAINFADLKAKVDYVVHNSSLESFHEFRPTNIVDKQTQAYIEVSGKEGSEKVYYFKDGKRRQAKIDKEASARQGYVVAIVPKDAQSVHDGQLADLVERSVTQGRYHQGFSVLINKQGPSLIRVKGNNVEFKVGSKWVRRLGKKADLDGRGICGGKRIRPTEDMLR